MTELVRSLHIAEDGTATWTNDDASAASAASTFTDAVDPAPAESTAEVPTEPVE